MGFITHLEYLRVLYLAFVNAFSSSCKQIINHILLNYITTIYIDVYYNVLYETTGNKKEYANKRIRYLFPSTHYAQNYSPKKNINFNRMKI